MIPLLCRVVGAVVALLMLCGCALTKDRFRAIPTQGQTEVQRLQDQEDCNAIALANKGSAAQASAAMGAMGVAVGAGAGAAIGAGLGGALVNAGTRAAAGAGAGAAAGLLTTAIIEVKRRGTAIYTACMVGRGYKVGE